ETCSGKQLWRIIGVVEGNLKLISTEYYSTGVAWDTSNSSGWAKPVTLNTTLENNVYENIEWINSSTQKEWITNDRWKLGGISSNFSLVYFESAEKNSSFTTSNHIGLMTVTDYVYASSNSQCKSNTALENSNSCAGNNWLKIFSGNPYEWTMTRYSGYGNTAGAYYISSYSAIYSSSVANAYSARPVVILDSDVKIVGGTGTESDPYLLGK
ncbi:MAG: hypothetical protein HFH09_04720, partial [Bacilli bacterium]|nr:hypothetical protein [Bacilli bacterium]